jgi:hypothetical protein
MKRFLADVKHFNVSLNGFLGWTGEQEIRMAADGPRKQEERMMTGRHPLPCLPVLVNV